MKPNSLKARVLALADGHTCSVDSSTWAGGEVSSF